MPFTSNIQDEPEKSQYQIGFPRGVNTIQDRSLVNDKNLIQADNAIIVVDGIERRLGTDKAFDEAGATIVYGSKGFYNKTAGTRKYVRAAAARLQYLNGSVWTNIAATAYTNANTEFVQARNRLYVYNGTDNLTYYDGSSLTTYTAVDTPSGLTVTATGAAGTTAYSYRVSAFNATGETIACTAVAIANGNATLSATNYNALDWDNETGATGYNIFGRTATGYGHVYLATVYGNTNSLWNDTGSETPVTSHLPPETDSTAGIKAKYAVYSRGRQWAAGVTEGSTYYPTRVYWTGTLDYSGTYAGGEYGGGWVEIDSNDGGEIMGIFPYRNGVIVGKTTGIYRTYFTSDGTIAVDEITKGHGLASHRSFQSMDNDIIYTGIKDNKLEVYAIGYQQNYTDDILRTNNISIFISDQLSDMNSIYIENVASFYWDNKYGFTYTTSANTTNSQGWILDTRFGGWCKWNGLPMQSTHYTVYDNGTTKTLYGGSTNTGYMIEMFKANTYNDDGAAYTTTIGTKFYNGGMFDIEKIFRNPTLWFKYITGGSLTVELWIDGTRKVGSASLSSTDSGIGFGADLFGQQLFGDMIASTGETIAYSDLPMELSGIFNGYNIGFYIICDQADVNFRYMGLHLLFTPLVGKPLPQDKRFEIT